MRLYRYIKKSSSKFAEKVMYLTENSNFLRDVRILRKEWEINVKTDQDKNMDRLLWNKEFDKSITRLIKRNKLEKNIRDWLYRYIIYNDTESFNPEESIILQDKNDFFIKINPETNLKDVARAFEIIKELQGVKNKRTRIKKNLTRDKEIFKLSNEGKSTEEIWSSMKKKGHDLDFGNIKNIISRINKKIKG